MCSTCSICLNELESADMFCLPCSHSFHTECINRWLETQANVNAVCTCPECRSVVFPEEGEAWYRLNSELLSLADVAHVFSEGALGTNIVAPRRLIANYSSGESDSEEEDVILVDESVIEAADILSSIPINIMMWISCVDMSLNAKQRRRIRQRQKRKIKRLLQDERRLITRRDRNLIESLVAIL